MWMVNYDMSNLMSFFGIWQAMVTMYQTLLTRENDLFQLTDISFDDLVLLRAMLRPVTLEGGPLNIKMGLQFRVNHLFCTYRK